MALDTVADYIGAARTLLQDKVEPYRYTTAELVEALGFAVLEARRLRPDLFLNRFTSLPDFEEGDVSAEKPVDIDPQYRMAFVYYIVGNAQLRDEEDTQDARATVFLNKFIAQLLDIKA